MKNTRKILLAGSTAIAFGLVAGSAVAQVVPSANPTGGTLTTDPFVSGGAPTITNTTPVVVPGGVQYDSTAVESGTTDFQDLGNSQVAAGGVTVTANVEGVYNTTQTTVTHIDTSVPSSTTDPTTEVNTVDSLTVFNVSGSTGVPVDFVEITSDPSTISGNTVAVTQTNGSFTGGGLTFATYEGTATYVGTNDIDVTFNSTPTSETTLDGAGLTTTGDVNATNVTATGAVSGDTVTATTSVTAPIVYTDTVESATGPLTLGVTGGTSYVQVNADSVVLHGGTSSTTQTIDDAGVAIVNDTVGGGTFSFTNTDPGIAGGGADFLIDQNGALSSGNAALNGGALTVDDDLFVTGATTLDGNATVNGALTVGGLIEADGGLVAGDGIAAVTSAAEVTRATVNQAALATGLTIDSTTQRISGLANGTVSATSSEAITGAQLYATNTRVGALETGLTALTGRVGALETTVAANYAQLMDRADKAYQGVAMGFALNAAPLNLANGEGGLSGGVGYFQGQWAGAVKAQYVTDAGVGLGVNVGFSADAVGGGVGASIKF